TRGGGDTETRRVPSRPVSYLRVPASPRLPVWRGGRVGRGSGTLHLLMRSGREPPRAIALLLNPQAFGVRPRDEDRLSGLCREAGLTVVGTARPETPEAMAEAV